ncbi:hypothetical protein [Chryseobacterium lactis]|uniref:hypothetical protein n=1 Tax=Chryseobacterium lactis TaxID=1241981 RepID=UPI001623E810|nr:hypothetical protein [Chryseobacterium lactis]
MAIPKKKRRTITVNQTEYYWRKVSDRCLYIETGQNPNGRIKAYFEKGYFAVPQVVRAVIDYTINNKHDNNPLTIVENGDELFKTELEKHQQKRREENEEQFIRSNIERHQKGWNEYHTGKKYILEKDYFKALYPLMNSIRIDPLKKERWSLFESFISEDIKSAELLNERANYYRTLSKDTETQYQSYCRKAAFKDIEDALNVNPDCAIAYGTLAELLYDENDLGGFYYNWEKALEKGMTQSIDGFIRFDLKDTDEFIRISQKYLK